MVKISCLRAVQCPFDNVDQIGRWTKAGIGHAYGSGYILSVLDELHTKVGSGSAKSTDDYFLAIDSFKALIALSTCSLVHPLSSTTRLRTTPLSNRLLTGG